MSTLLQARQQPITAPRLRDRVAAQRATPRAAAGHQPAASVPNCPVEAPRARWRLRSVARRELASFDDRILRDIGLDPGMVDYEMRQSFWRPLRDWRD
jgi:uncharacterized protein YjiS (DUF1127 family)